MAIRIAATAATIAATVAATTFAIASAAAPLPAHAVFRLLGSAIHMPFEQ